MILSRYLLLEVAKTQFAVFFILMTIFISQKFVGILGDASEGGIPGTLVMTFIALKAPELAGMLMPLSMFLGILLAYGRIYADSEMTVLHACGVSEWYIVRVTLFVAFLVAIATAVVTLYLAPLAMEKEYQLQEEATSKSGIAAVVPGRFQETGEDNSVVFVHDIDTENEKLVKVFLAQPNNSDEDIHLIYANGGNIQQDASGGQQLVLEKGTQYEGTTNANDYQIVQFDEYAVTLEKPTTQTERRKVVAIPTLDLWDMDTIEAKAEFQWRLAIPLSLPFLVLIAVPLSAVDPRQGRFGKMLPALLLYLGYFLLLLASRRIMEDGKLPSFLGLWWVHVVMLLIGTGLIVRERKAGALIRRLFSSNKEVSAPNV